MAVQDLLATLAEELVDDPEQVQRLYEIALSNGCAGEGAPSDCGGFYAAYFRDPEGNKIMVMRVGE